MSKRDHGGGIDAAMAEFGGSRADWLDLSTGINPTPYPRPDLPAESWAVLPDQAAFTALERAARAFWSVPEEAVILPASGASALIAALPLLAPAGPVYIPAPTYNEHAAAFRAHGHEITQQAGASTHVYVHPNNPDGRLWADAKAARLTIIDESFCDVTPNASRIVETARPGTLILKSFGKFWGLAGLRLGFAIAHPDTLKTKHGTLADQIGPWAVSGPGLAIGAQALTDRSWAKQTRARLFHARARLDRTMAPTAPAIGGTDLFGLYDLPDAASFQNHLARHHIWSRIFPYSQNWVRLGLPPADRWSQLDEALSTWR